MDDGRVVHREHAILFGDEHADFRAAENHTFSTTFFQAFNDALVFCKRCIENLTQTEFIENHVVHNFNIRSVRHNHFEASALKAFLDKVLRHREFGTKQCNFRKAIANNACCSRIGNVQNRDMNFMFDLRDKLVHRIRCNHDKVRPRTFKTLCSIRENRRIAIPIAIGHVRFEFCKIDTVHQDFCAVETAQCAHNFFIQNFIVRDCTFPTHAANQTNCLHKFLRYF